MHVRVSAGPAIGGAHESVRMELCNALEYSPSGCGWPWARRNLRAEPKGTTASPATYSGKQARRSPYIPPIDPPQLVRITALARRAVPATTARAHCTEFALAPTPPTPREPDSNTFGLTPTDCESAGRQLLR